MKIICDRYGVDDGMKNPECNGGFQPAAWKTSEQKLYFPTVDGLVGVDPGMVDEPGIPPGVHIENIKSNGKMISSHPGMTIGPGVNRLEFHYTSLSFRLPGQLRFRFKLDGYDREWEVVEGSSDRLAVYRYLQPGQYCFQVQAGLDRAGWGLSSTRFEFTVLPYFWQTGWFKLLVAIAFAILSFFLITGIRKLLGIVHFWKRKTRIGNYRIVRKLGSGGMGTVYLARSLHASGRQVALKVLREEFTTDDIQIRRLEQEAMIIDQIDHANIVNVIERGRHDQNIYIAMEYLQGITLAGLISRKDKVTVSEGIHILKQVALALRVIHRKSIVHRDLKPDNIMIIRKPQDPLFVKVLDFGLARSESFTRLTESGIVLGTIAYLAPEQIRENRFSPASDVYSLGVTAYESFTGKRPFDGTSSMELMNKILNDTPDDPGLLNPDLPQDLNALILRMMSRDISLRPDINDIVRIFSGLDPESLHHPTTPIHKLR
jgi:tRNA A-37 threonylcarbamoyl transferase component Bud32